MTEIQPFTFPTTGQPVRTIVRDGEPWFVARDVTNILGIANGRDALSRVNEADKGVGITDTPGGPQQTALVNESGLYDLILESRKPDARTFRRWVTADVVPAVRRTGSYSAPTLEIPTTYAAALRAAAEQAERAELAEKQVAELEPAAHAWNILATAAQDYDVAEAAQVLSRDPAIRTGRTRLFTILAREGWIYRGGSPLHWKPYQRHVELGRLMVMPKSHYHPRTGDLVLDPPQVRITVKGIEALHKLLGGQASVSALVAS